MVLGLLVGFPAPAGAAELVTEFPSVAVQPGATSTFPIEVRSSVVERVGLSVEGVPEDWRAVLRGGGHEVSAAYTGPDDPATVQLEVDVPANASAGVKQLTVVAEAPSGDDRLLVELRVDAQAAEAFSLSTEFPHLQGGPSDTFTFDVQLENNSASAATFNLTAAAPEGWSAEASPTTEQRASTVTVESGSTATIRVEADPPDSVAADSYPLVVRAQGAGRTLEAELTAEIVGTAQLSLNTVSQRLNASGGAGEATEIRLLVTNDGGAPLQGVSFTATPPSDWEVTFEPEQIDMVPPGESTEVTALVRPTGDAVAGDYVVSLRANGGSSSDTVDIRFTVETSNAWGFAGVGLIVVAVGALVWTFRRFGRR